MRWVVEVEGKLEVKWTWLPMWLAMNQPLVAELQSIVDAHTGGTDDAALDALDMKILLKLTDKFPGLPGLGLFLSGLREVELAMIRSLYAMARFFIGAGIHAMNDTVTKQEQQIKKLETDLEIVLEERDEARAELRKARAS